MNRLIILLLLWIPVSMKAQIPDTVSLQVCYDSARSYYPVFREKGMISEALDLKLRNLTASWYPQISLNGQANYNSDVTRIDIDLPVAGIELPKSPHDQYKVTMDVNQVVWDGGVAKRQKALEKVSASAEVQQLEVEMQSLREKINRTYLILLLLQENEKVFQSTIKTLNEKLLSVQSAVKNGALAPVQEQVLKAEILKNEHQLFCISSDRQAALSVLSQFTGLPLQETTVLSLPDIPDNSGMVSLNRPEQVLFDLQADRTEQLRQVSATKNLPKIFAFGQAGYGKPGLNMLQENWKTYWVVGAGFKWNLWDWEINRREQEILDVQRQKILTDKETFELNVHIQLDNEASNIRKYRDALRRDEEIVDLRQDILKTVSTQVDNGIATSTDYITELNALIQAQIAMQTDRLLMIQSALNYNTIQGQSNR